MVRNLGAMRRLSSPGSTNGPTMSSWAAFDRAIGDDEALGRLRSGRHESGTTPWGTGGRPAEIYLRYGGEHRGTGLALGIRRVSGPRRMTPTGRGE
jgi:hypothetical protein